VPSCGWTSIPGASAAEGTTGAAKASVRALENDLLRVEFDQKGDATSIFDRKTGRELAAGACGLRMFKDVPSNCDAWDIDSQYVLTPLELDAPASFEVVAEGPLVAKLRITRRVSESNVTQIVSLRRGSRRVDFETVVEWRESHKMLKVCFPVDVHAHEAVHEIQFGHIKRPNHKSRQFDADRFEVSNHRWTALVEEARGFAVLNDCKYGVNVEANSVNLTLLRSPLCPDMNADKGRQEFTYALYVWTGCFMRSGVVREGYELNCPVRTSPGSAGERSLFSVDAPNVVIETVKPAEDGSDDIVVRLYEAKRTATRCTLSTTLPAKSAAETDMLEDVKQELGFADGGLTLEFRAFEVKTVRLRV